MAEQKDFLMYKGKPLVRSGKTIYYGYPYEPYVAMLQVMATDKMEELDIASKVMVQLISTDESKSPLERIIKKADKPGLYEGLSIASIWLERILAEGTAN